MEIRQLEKWDRVPLVEHLTGALVHDPMSDALAWEKVWGDARLSPGMTLVAAEADHIFGFGMALIGMSQNGPYGVIKILSVDAAHRNQGLGSELLESLEIQLAQMGVKQIRIGESPPNYLWPGIDLAYTAGLVFFQRRGYQYTGEVYDLKVPLSKKILNTTREEAALKQAGFEIRRAVEADHDKGAQFLKAFWPDWAYETEICFHNDPVSLHVALHEGHMVGFAAHNANNRGTGSFGPMGTAPLCRKKGIGNVLLKRCLTDIYQQGFSHGIIPWVGPYAFYSRSVGAFIHRVYHRYAKDLAKTN